MYLTFLRRAGRAELAGPKRGSVDNARHPSVKSYRPNDRESPPAGKKEEEKRAKAFTTGIQTGETHTHISRKSVHTDTDTTVEGYLESDRLTQSK